MSQGDKLERPVATNIFSSLSGEELIQICVAITMIRGSGVSSKNGGLKCPPWSCILYKKQERSKDLRVPSVRVHLLQSLRRRS